MHNVGLLDVAQEVFTTGVSHRATDVPALVDGEANRIVDLVIMRLPEQAVAMVFDDVTEERRARALLEHAASHDPLTGLRNRSALREAIQSALREEIAFAVVLMDLDGFKEVNDRHGHQAGDDLLVLLSERLRAAVGDTPGATVARLGGDEFAALVPIDTRSAAQVGAAIHAVIDAPVDLDVGVLTVGASVGVAVHRRGWTEVSELLRRADVAMYDAKRRGLGVMVSG